MSVFCEAAEQIKHNNKTLKIKYYAKVGIINGDNEKHKHKRKL